MIIIGYQGIGKSTLAKGNMQYIDLESSNFFIDGKRPDGWEKMYTRIAEHLSEQGYTVFTSCHKEVQDALRESKEEVCICCPSLELKDCWLHKLEDRYNLTNSDKDYRAWMNAVQKYDDSISVLISAGFKLILLSDMDYSLHEEICNHVKRGLFNNFELS